MKGRARYRFPRACGLMQVATPEAQRFKYFPSAFRGVAGTKRNYPL